MNSSNPLLRLVVACLAMASPLTAAGNPAILAQPTSLAVTFPLPLPTTELPESAFPGAYLVFRPGTGPFPPAFPTQLNVLFSRSGNGYTGLGTSGPWFYRSIPNGGAGITFFVNEDGGRILFYRDYLLETNGTYQVFARNRDGERLLIQVGTYHLYDYEGPASRITATFSVTVESPDEVSRQWYFDGVPLEDGITSPFIYYFESVAPAGWTSVAGAQTSTLSISNVTRLNAGSYYCVLSTLSGSVTSAVATLTVNGQAARDLTPPTAQITAPEQSEFVGTEPIQFTFISGTASDDTGVGSVFLLFGTNHYGPMNIGPVADSMKETLWGGSVYLVPGSNYLGAYAVDVYGNRSSTNARVIYYQSNSVPTEIAFHLTIDGGGTVTPLTNGQRIWLGQNYELRAAPLSGYQFDHWSEGPHWQSSNPVISFAALDGQSFTAHFVYRLLEQAPVARIKVRNELKLPPIDAEGHSLFDDRPPSHLQNPADYLYPGYRGFWHYLLAPDTHSIPFVLDASGSRDPDGNALKYGWSYYTGGEAGDFLPLGGTAATRSPFFRNRPARLENVVRHELVVTVEDRYVADRLWFGVMVLRPQDAAGLMGDWLQDHFSEEKDLQGVVSGSLVPLLAEAESRFAAGNLHAGRHSLRQFERLATSRLKRLDPLATRALLACTRAILDVTEKSGL